MAGLRMPGSESNGKRGGVLLFGTVAAILYRYRTSLRV